MGDAREPRSAGDVFDEHAETYDSELNASIGSWGSAFGGREYLARYKAETVARLASREPRSILDFGCGIGRNLPSLSKCFPSARLAGCDVSAESLRVAAPSNPEVELALVSEMSGRFDMVFVVGVFHHVPIAERPSVASDMAARVASGGEIFVFEHNPRNPISRKIVADCPFDEDAVLLRPEETAALLSATGLEIVGVHHVLLVPPALRFMARAERALARFPLGGQYVVHARRPEGDET